MSETLRARLQAELQPAIRRRDRAAVSALRSTLAAIDNAAAVAPVDHDGSLTTEQTAVGVGAREVARRDLTDEDVARIVHGEIAEREAAAVTYSGAGQETAAGRLRAEAAVLAAIVQAASNDRFASPSA